MVTSPIPAVRRYRLLPEGLPAAERRVRDRQLIPYMAIFTALILVSSFLGYRRGFRFDSILVLLVLIALYLTYTFFAVPRRTRKRVVSFWSSYTLEIGPDYLLRQVADTRDVRLPFSEVRSIERRNRESLRVIGTNPLQVIYIPPGIEHFDEIWQTLSPLAPVKDRADNRELRANLVTAACATGYLTMLWSKSAAVVFTLAAALVGVFVWRIRFILRSPNVHRQARSAVWTYLFVILIVGLRVATMVVQMRGR